MRRGCDIMHGDGRTKTVGEEAESCSEGREHTMARQQVDEEEEEGVFPWDLGRCRLIRKMSFSFIIWYTQSVRKVKITSLFKPGGGAFDPLLTKNQIILEFKIM